MEFNLKGSAKLAETCFRFFGGLWEPTAIRRKAIAKAEEKAILGEAEQREEIRKIETEAMKALRQREILDNFPVLAEISPEFHEFAKNGMSRVIVQEARRQQNIETIYGQADLALPDDSQINDEPVEEDWINNFFENCKDIGDAEMQALWGKILAGEVAQPGSYSRRTLATLRLMNKDEVLTFEKFWIYVWGIDQALGMAFNKHFTKQDFLTMNGLNPWWRMQLQSLGLINTNISFKLDPGVVRIFYYGDDEFKIENKTDSILKLPGDVLTPVGNEFSRISAANIDNVYREDVLQLLFEQGFSVTHIKGPNPPA